MSIIERPHRATNTQTSTSELFICFTSHLSKSSSLRRSSKSILSPAHTTTIDKSPTMFPSKKTRGSSGFAENPEPSSPKVTCIGQVRVKTKKQGKKMKMRACRSKRLSGGEASFRRIEHTHDGISHGIQNQECGLNLNHRNQRWVHLPLTICEALRAFGNEFSCLFPCKSSCFSSGGEKGRKVKEENENEPNSCAVFRWLVSLQEVEEEEKRKDIELVVGGEEVRCESIMMERECSRRRSIFDDIEFDDLFNKNEDEIGNDNGGDEEEGSRVSICIPPKNALLLMRCRSDPMKMASLSHKLWEPQLDNDDEEVKDVNLEVKFEVKEDKEEEFIDGYEKIEEILDLWVELPNFIEEDDDQDQEEEMKLENRGKTEHVKCDFLEETHVEDEMLDNGFSIEAIVDEGKVENGGNEQDLTVNLEENQQEQEEQDEESLELSRTTTSTVSNSSEESIVVSKEREKEEIIPNEIVEKKIQEGRKSTSMAENKKSTLPDCLLLMMCEPKVSMEVSKETWVCSNDFIRRHPNKTGNKLGGSDDTKKKKPPPLPVQQRFEPVVQPLVQPARSSISFPACGGTVANLIEQKLLNGGGAYEPLVLTRCKSAPLRSAAAKIAPSDMACSLWGRDNGRKMEPHRPATFGVETARVGF